VNAFFRALSLFSLGFFVCLAFSSFTVDAALAKDAPKTVAQAQALPLPDRTGGLPLNEAINKRRSYRNFEDKDIEPEKIGQILWSAFGVNREAGKMRTIPTAHNRQNVLVFAVLKSGVWLYDALKHQLVKRLDGDFTKDFSGAPLTLLYAVPDSDGAVGGIHVGLAAQDVGLTCASLGLANVLKTTGANTLADKLSLKDQYKILAIHNVAYPKGTM
jgi:nitroreductase